VPCGRGVHSAKIHIHALDANICASIKVRKTLVRNESEGGLGPLWWDAAD